MRTIETKVYKFDELSDLAKETARDWFRDSIEVDEWSEDVIDDAVTIGGLFGLGIGTRTVKLMGGSTRQEPAIYFDLGRAHSIEFTWNYSYIAGSVNAVKEYAPVDTDLHQIVEGLQSIQKKNFYQIQSSKGRYGVDVTRLDDKSPTNDAESEVEYWLQQFGEWILSNLDENYEWYRSDNNVDENIRINEYEFTENGEIM